MILFGLDENESNILKNLWHHIENDLEMISEEFYNKLFSKRENLRKLFPENMESQQIKLIKTLAFILEFDKLEKNIVYIHKIGKRHKGYKVKKEDYKIFCDTLVETISEFIGISINKDQIEILRKYYYKLGDIMIEGSNKSSSYFNKMKKIH